MKTIIYLLAFTSILSCTNQKGKKPKDIVATIKTITQKPFITNLSELKTTKESTTYNSTLKSIESIKNALVLSDTSQDSLQEIFTKSLLQKIIPYWQGTLWSFEGHSSTPNQGSIACGYFVSTTLKDVGFHLNRYKLAQQNPYNEAKSIALDTEVKIFENRVAIENKNDIDRFIKDGIYFIGFDNSHVGYITKLNGELYIIHSNYIGSQGVMIEHIDSSQVFQSYNKYYIAELSTNIQLLKYWVNGTELKVIEK